MARNRYDMPTAHERNLRGRLAASQARCASLLADCTGTAEIV